MFLLGVSFGDGAWLVVFGGLVGFVLVRLWDWRRGGGVGRERLERLAAAEREAEEIRRRARLAGGEEVEGLRRVLERRFDEQEGRLGERERLVLEREGLLGRELEGLAGREGVLEERRRVLEGDEGRLVREREEVGRLVGLWRERLAGLGNLTEGEARGLLMREVEGEARREGRVVARGIVERAREGGEVEARRIVGLAIQRFAGAHVSALTTASVGLGGDDIKGRIIGREGRNIRAFENATGVTVLIDDVPNAVVLSGFDPVRREVARVSMERLVADGRIHPTRIDEVVREARAGVEERVFRVAEEAVVGLGLAPVHREVARLLGGLYFRLSFSQNVLDHSVEVARLTGLLAGELGLDVVEGMRAGLLHDVGKGLSSVGEGSHAVAGGEFVRRFGESDVVADAVVGHHGEGGEVSVLGALVGAADAISAARPGARSEPVVAYVERLRGLEEIGCSFAGVERCFAVQAGREVRVFVRPGEVDDEGARVLARDVCRRIEERLEYVGQIRVSVIREVCCVDFAK